MLVDLIYRSRVLMPRGAREPGGGAGAGDYEGGARPWRRKAEGAELAGAAVPRVKGRARARVRPSSPTNFPNPQGDPFPSFHQLPPSFFSREGSFPPAKSILFFFRPCFLEGRARFLPPLVNLQKTPPFPPNHGTPRASAPGAPAGAGAPRLGRGALGRPPRHGELLPYLLGPGRAPLAPWGPIRPPLSCARARADSL